MGTFIDILTAPPKGLRIQPKYYPEVGERCLVSGPNCDNDRGYSWIEVSILWKNDIFVLYGVDNMWPVLNKWEHVLFKPLKKEVN